VNPVGTVHLLVNPSSRRGTKHAAAVTAGLSAAGVRVEHLSTSGPDDVAASIRRAAPERVVAVGGDGLVHHALPALIGTDTVLGMVPSGTGNDFARALGLPTGRRRATRQAMADARPVDLLRVEFDDGASALAATVVTAGFSGNVTSRANQRSFPRGRLRYTVASFAELRQLACFDVQLSEPSALSGLTTILAVANTRFFGGGMAIAPAADPADGYFEVVVVGDVSAATLALVLPTVFLGQHTRHPAVRTGRGRQASIRQHEEVWADGEHIGRGPFTVEVVPAALLVAGC
jgi:diacylglycerol kinase (ATP)